MAGGAARVWAAIKRANWHLAPGWVGPRGAQEPEVKRLGQRALSISTHSLLRPFIHSLPIQGFIHSWSSLTFSSHFGVSLSLLSFNLF